MKVQVGYVGHITNPLTAKYNSFNDKDLHARSNYQTVDVTSSQDPNFFLNRNQMSVDKPRQDSINRRINFNNDVVIGRQSSVHHLRS